MSATRMHLLHCASDWHKMKLIWQRLGHANIAITLDMYAHSLPAAYEQAANTLARRRMPSIALR
jgi:hypothetical protein